MDSGEKCHVIMSNVTKYKIQVVGSRRTSRAWYAML